MNPERIRILDLLADANIDIMPASEYGGPVGQWVAIRGEDRCLVTIAGPHPSYDLVEQAALAFIGQK